MDYGERLQNSDTIESITTQVSRLDESGVAAIWMPETVRDPYMTIAVAAGASSRIALGTGIAVAFARSPYATAQSAYYAQRLSGGRFRLGLSTQVKAHIERRFGMQWNGGAGAMRDYVDTLNAIFHTWQTGEKPDFEGRFYRFTLTNPEFSPQPLPDAHAHIPIWLAAVGTIMSRLAGEVADGLHVHAFHTPGYLRDVVISGAREGRATAGRTDPVLASCPVFAGIARDEGEVAALRDEFRQHIAFYSSTVGYLPVLEHAGIAEIHAPLLAFSRERRWSEMPALVTDEMLDLFAIFDEPASLARRLKDRYNGLLTELALYKGGAQFARADDMAVLVEELARPGG